jgi:uncharacterized repeat protein (TIGR01451 family)
MRISRLVIAANILILLGCFSLNAQAATGDIKIKSIAETDVTTVGRDGKNTVKRTPVEKAIPGTEVIFTNTFENIGGKTASGIVINNPVSSDMEYKGGSAFGRDCMILFSVDGKTFAHAEELKVKNAEGRERTALPKEYTAIRWTYNGQLPPGKSGAVGFTAVVK